MNDNCDVLNSKCCTFDGQGDRGVVGEPGPQGRPGEDVRSLFGYFLSHKSF